MSDSVFVTLIYDMFTTSLIAAMHKVKGHYERK